MMKLGDILSGTENKTYDISREIEMVKAAKLANPAMEIPADIEAVLAAEAEKAMAAEKLELAQISQETTVTETTKAETTRFNEELEKQYPYLKEMRIAREKRAAEMRLELSEKFPGRQITEMVIHDAIQGEKQEAVCETCAGYPCKKTVNQGWRTAVQADYWNGLTVVKYECLYSKERRSLAKHRRLFENAKIPLRYSCAKWDDYEVTADNKNAVGWAKYVLENKLEQWLYFQGAPGTGKTLLVSIMARELINSGKEVIFVDTPGLLNELRGSFNKDSEVDVDAKMAALEKIDVLILDDLGTESVTEWAAERMYQIINTRYNSGKQTLITSNLTLNEIAAKFNNPRNGKPGQTGSRMASRLTEMCKIATLKGADRRLKK